MTDLTAAEQAVAKTLNAALLPFLIAGATPQDLDPLIDALTIDLRYLLKEELLLYRRDEGGEVNEHGFSDDVEQFGYDDDGAAGDDA